MSFRGQVYAQWVSTAAEWCLNHRLVTTIIAVLVLSIASAGATQVSLDPSPETYLHGTKSWKFYQQVDQEYEIGETIVIALYEPGGSVFDVETIRAVAELSRILTQMSGVERVTSLSTAQNLSSDGPEGQLNLTPLHAGPVTPQSALALGQQVLKHPVYSQFLVDAEHETTFLFTQIGANFKNPDLKLELIHNIRQEVYRFATAHRSTHLAGPAITKEAIADGVRRDTILFFPASLVLLMVLLWLIFGEFVAALVPFVVVGGATLIVTGTLSLAGIRLNIATATIPTVILVIGLADSIHFLYELRRHYARTGHRRTSLLKTVESIALPCLLTSATSAVGFTALFASSVGPLREFGIAAALGIISAYACSMLLIPVLLATLRYPRKKYSQFPAAPLLGRKLKSFAIQGHQRLPWTLAITGLLFGICIAGIAELKVDSHFVGYLSQTHRLRKDIEVVERGLGGVDSVHLILDADKEGYFRTPEGIKVLDTLSKDLRQLEGVSRVFGAADYLRLANAVVAGLPQHESGELPANEQQIAQLILLDPSTFSALANPEMSQARITMQVRSMSSKELLELLGIAQQTIQFTLKDRPLKAQFTGLPQLFAQVVEHLMKEAANSFVVAALLIYLALLVGLRSPWLATAAMVPNLLTVGLTFTCMVALKLTFDTYTAFVGCLGIGIAVDDTIHIVTRYQRAREEGAPNPPSAVQYAITHAGHPVVLTSLLLCIGFSVLLLSNFTPTVRVGLLAIFLVIWAVVLDLFLLPVLLMAVDRFEKRYQGEALVSSQTSLARFRDLISEMGSRKND